MSTIMDSLRKWFYKPRRDDTSHLAQFFYADEALNLVAAELDSFDGRKDPDRCTTLVNHLRQCQDKVLTICNRIMDEIIPNERADRDFRVKFPDDVMQDNLAGQLWFGAECLAAGSSIMNRESESGAMRPLAKALTKALENVRNLLREAALRSVPYCSAPNLVDQHTEKLVESLKVFDRLLADFELAYVSAMVPVKSVQEYELQQCVVVLFSETLQRALKIGLLTQEMVDQYDPALMFTIPRLAIVAGLLIYPHGPLSLNSPQTMSDMFRPFRTLLMKIRELLWTLTENELISLEKMLCSSEEPLPRSEGQKVMQDMKGDLDETQEWTADLTEFESELEKNMIMRCVNDNSSVSSTLTCVEQSFNEEDSTVTSDVTSSMGRTLLPHLFFLNQMSDDSPSLQSPLSSDFSTVQSNSDNSLSDRSPDFTDPYKGPSTSAETWTLHVIPCECSYSRCLPNCDCSRNEDVRWTKSDRQRVDRTCASIDCSSRSHSDRSDDSNELHRNSRVCSSNNNIETETLSNDNNFNLNKNFSKEIIDKNLSNICASEVVLKDYVERTSSVQGGSGETSNSVNGKYEGNWETISSVGSSNAEDIRRHKMQVEGDGIASSFSSSCSSCQSTVSAISNSVSSDTSSYNSDCRDEMEVALAVKAAELTNNQEARSKFRSSADLVHRLFVCVSGVADQLQTNFAGDLRNILKAVFLIHASDRNDYDTLEDPNNGECCERGEDAVVWGERDVESPPAWVPDQAAPTCMSCQAQFTVVRRRHHCRNCGKVFCARCSSNSVPLPRYGHLKPVRVCNRCYIYQVTPFTIDQNIATAN